jgi:hypothetical protein
VGVVYGGAAVCYLDVAPAAMRIEGDEEIDGAVAEVLVIIALALSGLGRDRLTHLADELDGSLVEADQRPLGIRRLGIEIEHVLHAGDIFAVDVGSAPHVPSPVTLEQNGFIRRQPGVPRSIQILLPPENLPILEWLGIKTSKSL